MRTVKAMAAASALVAATLIAPATASAGHMKGHDCFQAMADHIKAKMARLDAKIDAMHAWKMSKHKAHAVAAPAPAKVVKVAAKKPAKPMK